MVSFIGKVLTGKRLEGKTLTNHLAAVHQNSSDFFTVKVLRYTVHRCTYVCMRACMHVCMCTFVCHFSRIIWMCVYIYRLKETSLLGRAKVHKDEGNDFFKNKKYREAIDEYTEGIKQNSSDLTMNAVLYCNRATAHFYLGIESMQLCLCVYFMLQVITDLQ